MATAGEASRCPKKSVTICRAADDTGSRNSYASRMNTPLAAGIALSLLAGCAPVSDAPSWRSLGEPSEVRLRQTETGFELIRNGEAFFVRGAGGVRYLPELAQMGGNAIRTWDGEGIDSLMNEAHALGLAVQVGIWLEHERHGHDYDDPAVRAEQLAKVERLVTRYRHHPALLTWGVGNEVELGGDLGKALRAIEEAAALIKRLDPHHPTVAVIAEIGDDKAARIAAECPSIDLIGVNSYGGMASVPERLVGQGYEGAYMITEFGPLGHWEGASSDWGAPYEMTSSQKADFIADNYAKAVAAQHPGACVGSFAFLWGNKQETTETWFGLFLPTGEKTEAVERLGEFWSGKPATEHAPRVRTLRLGLDNPGMVRPGRAFEAEVSAEDPDGDRLSVEWRVIAESSDRKTGGDAEATPPVVGGTLIASEGMKAELRAPDEPGAYRVFVTVRDGRGWGGTANLPFRVVGEE